MFSHTSWRNDVDVLRTKFIWNENPFARVKLSFNAATTISASANKLNLNSCNRLVCHFSWMNGRNRTGFGWECVAGRVVVFVLLSGFASDISQSRTTMETSLNSEWAHWRTENFFIWEATRMIAYADANILCVSASDLVLPPAPCTDHFDIKQQLERRQLHSSQETPGCRYSSGSLFVALSCFQRRDDGNILRMCSSFDFCLISTSRDTKI